MSEILIYEEDGKVRVDVLMDDDTLWLSLNQISDLFERDKSVISRHLKKIFEDEELDSSSVVANYATTASDGKTYQVDYYNLDAIISVGYRVNSKRGTQFRQWANRILKDYLLKGYALSQRRLLTRGISELEDSIALLSRTLTQQSQLSDINKEAVRIIQNYARSWKLLLQYDEQRLGLPEAQVVERKSLSYDVCLSCIQDLKKQLLSSKEASEIFGVEREEGLKAILGNMDQTFGSEFLYPSVEEAAAHLLYFVIKDHPFVDGNKRIGSFLFLLYLRLNDHDVSKINEVTLVALALLVAESRPSEKDLIIPLIINLIT